MFAKESTSRSDVKLHWRALLPVLMLGLSTVLMVLAEKQQPMLRGMGTGWEVPARVVNALLNGPGFYLGRLIPIPIPDTLNRNLNYDADRLPGIGVFWFLIGLSIDRRKDKRALDRQHPVSAGVLFTVAMLSSGFFGFGLGFARFLDLTFWRLIAEHPLRSSASMAIELVSWLLVFFAYFARRTFIALRRSLKMTA